MNRDPHGRRMNAIVLAAGKGSRMRSTLPKPLQPVNERPMVSYVVDAIAGLGVERTIVVVGHQGSLVRDTLTQVTNAGESLEFVEQEIQNGTAEAVRIALTAFDQEEFETDDGNMMVLPADMPLLTTATLAHLQEHHFNSGAAATLLTAEFTRDAAATAESSAINLAKLIELSNMPMPREKNSIFLKSTLRFIASDRRCC